MSNTIRYAFSSNKAAAFYLNGQKLNATPESAGVDLCANIENPVTIPPGGVVKIGTGLHILLADPARVGLVFSRSGLSSNHRVVLANGVGVIDSDYTDEILVALCNNGDKPYTVSPGDRVAQLVVLEGVVSAYASDEWQRVSKAQLSSAWGDRGGFGSTGIHSSEEDNNDLRNAVISSLPKLVGEIGSSDKEEDVVREFGEYVIGYIINDAIRRRNNVTSSLSFPVVYDVLVSEVIQECLSRNVFPEDEE